MNLDKIVYKIRNSELTEDDVLKYGRILITEFAKDYHTKQLTLTDVGCSKITALVTYWIWQDSGHALMDDYKHTFKKVVEVEKLTDINELFTNVAEIEILK